MVFLFIWLTNNVFLYRCLNTSWIICGARVNHVRSYALNHVGYQLFQVCMTVVAGCFSVFIFLLFLSYDLVYVLSSC